MSTARATRLLGAVQHIDARQFYAMPREIDRGTRARFAAMFITTVLFGLIATAPPVWEEMSENPETEAFQQTIPPPTQVLTAYYSNGRFGERGVVIWKYQGELHVAVKVAHDRFKKIDVPGGIYDPKSQAERLWSAVIDAHARLKFRPYDSPLYKRTDSRLGWCVTLQTRINRGAAIFEPDKKRYCLDEKDEGPLLALFETLSKELGAKIPGQEPWVRTPAPVP